MTLRLGRDAEQATDYLADTGVARAVLDTVEHERRDEAVAAVAAVLADHEGPNGVELSGGVHLITATTSSSPTPTAPVRSPAPEAIEHLLPAAGQTEEERDP